VLGQRRATGDRDSGSVAFYFKANGRYGKATITAMPVLRDDSSVQARIHYVLQPDGTRNLESAGYGRRIHHQKQ
jgi:hypothetical protein